MELLGLSKFPPCNYLAPPGNGEKPPRLEYLRGGSYNYSLVEHSGICYSASLMPIPKKTAFSRRLPDLVTEELAAVLSSKSTYEFKELFEVVHENLKARNAASGGEEMLRLRAYEKLQNLVARGMVKKEGKKYKGVPKQLATLQTVPPPIAPAGAAVTAPAAAAA